MRVLYTRIRVLYTFTTARAGRSLPSPPGKNTKEGVRIRVLHTLIRVLCIPLRRHVRTQKKIWGCKDELIFRFFVFQFLCFGYPHSVFFNPFFNLVFLYPQAILFEDARMLALRRKEIAEESMRKASLEGFARNQADMAREVVRHHAIQVIYSKFKKGLLCIEFYLGNILGHWRVKPCRVQGLGFRV